MRLNPEADLQFNSMGIGFNNNKLLVNDINGNIIIFTPNTYVGE